MDQAQVSPIAQPQAGVKIKTSWVRRVRARILRRRILMAAALGVTAGLFWSYLPRQAHAALEASFLANRTLVLSLLLFSAVTLSLLWSVGQRWDADLFLFINPKEVHSVWLDRAMSLGTQGGNLALALFIAVVLYLLNYARLGVELILGLLTLWFVVETIKALADRARPFAFLTDVRVIGWRALGRSFPSGHTSQAFFIVSLLTHHWPVLPIVSAGLYVVAALVGLTRIYVGAHYPRDVIAGALLCTVWGILTALVDPYLYGGTPL